MPVRRILWIDKIAGLPDASERFRALVEAGVGDLTVLAPRQWIENERPLPCHPGEREGYRIVTVPVMFKGNYSRGFFARSLKHVFLEARPDVVHLQEEPWSVFAWQAARAAERWAPRAKFVFYTWENIYRDFAYPSRLGFMHRPIDRLLHQKAAGALCPTEEARSVLERKGFAHPIAVVPFGVSGRFFNSPPAMVGEAAELSVGYVGRLLPMKGIDTLLDAASRVDEVIVKILGNGPERENLLQRARDLGMADRVAIEAGIPPDAVPLWMSTLDTLVLPSRTTPLWKEQFGRVLCEAMALGVPVIGSNSGAIPEVIGDAGLIFPEGDAAALAEAIRRLQEPVALKHLADAGRRRARERYTWEAFARGVVEFHEIIAQEG